MKPISDGRAVSIRSRGINGKTTTLYGVLKKEDTIYYPVYSTSSGKLLRYKTRKVLDGQLVPGAHGWYGTADLSDGYFFGTHVRGGDKLIITSGETDALSFAEALGTDKYTVWGLTKGEQSLVQAIESVGPKLMSYRAIYVAMDSDEAGQQALEAALDRLPSSSTFVVRYPSGVKDANELLLKQGAAAIETLLSKSQPIATDLVDSDEDVYSLLVGDDDDADNELLTTGYDWLDHLVGGWLRGHVYAVAADTGVGKTTLTMEWAVVYALTYPQERVMIASLEMSNRDIARKLVGIYLGVHSMHPRELQAHPNYKVAARWVADHFVLLKKKGYLLVDELTDMVKAAKLYGSKFFLLDHLTAAATGPDGLSWSGLDARAQALQAATAEENIIVVSVTHVSRREGKDDGDGRKPPTLRQVRGGNGLAQNSSVVLGVYAPEGKDEDTRAVKVLKVHRAEIGNWGEHWFTRLTSEEIEDKSNVPSRDSQQTKVTGRDDSLTPVEVRKETDREVPGDSSDVRKGDSTVRAKPQVHTGPNSEERQPTNKDRRSSRYSTKRHSVRGDKREVHSGRQDEDEGGVRDSQPRKYSRTGVRKPQ